MHLDAVSRENDLEHLKAKIEAGADFIITQLFYDTSLFLKFVQDCRAVGIKCPIIPGEPSSMFIVPLLRGHMGVELNKGCAGMMPIQTYGGFRRMTTLCKTYIPDDINQARLAKQNFSSALPMEADTLHSAGPGADSRR